MNCYRRGNFGDNLPDKSRRMDNVADRARCRRNGIVMVEDVCRRCEKQRNQSNAGYDAPAIEES